jgi:hypothetical protein
MKGCPFRSYGNELVRTGIVERLRATVPHDARSPCAYRQTDEVSLASWKLGSCRDEQHMDRHRLVMVDVSTFPAAMDYAVAVAPEDEARRRCSAGFLEFQRRLEPNHIVWIVVPVRLNDGLDGAADVSVASEPSFALMGAQSDMATDDARRWHCLFEVIPEVHRSKRAGPWVRGQSLIDMIDLPYYTVAHGDGQTKAAREASVDVGRHP